MGLVLRIQKVETVNCLLTATLGLDLSLLDRLAASIDYPVQSKVVINNGRPDALDKWKQSHPDWTVFTSGENVGCAGAWNAAPMLWPGEKAFLIVNDDQELQPGCLETIFKAADQQADDYDILYVNPYDAFDIFVWTAKGVRDFGLFDENFWPAYFEDYDMRARFAAGKSKVFYIGDKTFPIKHGKPHLAGSKYQAMLLGCGPLNEDYYLRKWGYGKFKTPFNNPTRSLGYWRVEVDGRAKRQKFWDAFWNQSNPSVYE